MKHLLGQVFPITYLLVFPNIFQINVLLTLKSPFLLPPQLLCMTSYILPYKVYMSFLIWYYSVWLSSQIKSRLLSEKGEDKKAREGANKKLNYNRLKTSQGNSV